MEQTRDLYKLVNPNSILEKQSVIVVERWDIHQDSVENQVIVKE
jgi:hypothetical protein